MSIGVETLHATAEATQGLSSAAWIAIGALCAIFAVFMLIFAYTMIYKDLEDFIIHHFTAWSLGHALLKKCDGNKDKAVEVVYKVAEDDTPIQIPE